MLVSVIKDHCKFGILSQKQGPVMNGMHDNINFKNTKSNKICLVDLLICTSKSTKCDYKLIPWPATPIDLHDLIKTSSVARKTI